MFKNSNLIPIFSITLITLLVMTKKDLCEKRILFQKWVIILYYTRSYLKCQISNCLKQIEHSDRYFIMILVLH